MHWLFLLLALAAMAFAFLTTSSTMLGICLLAALVFFVLWVLGLYSARVAGQGRDTAMMIDPAELRRLRELAELVIHVDAQRLEHPRCRMDLVLGLARIDALDEVREVASRLERLVDAALFNGARDPPRMLFLTEKAEDAN